MFCSKLLKTLGSAACLLTASSGFGDVLANEVLANESFDGYDTNGVSVADITTTLDGSKKMWSGYGYIDAGGATSFAPGFPISGTHTNVLTVEGYVVCSNDMSTTEKAAQVDMMVKVALPDEALSTTGLEDAQIAVAVDTAGKLNVYCQSKAAEGGNLAWRPVTGTEYTEGTWLRVGLVFDYNNSACQLRVNAEPVSSTNGSETAALGGTGAGSWFRLANAPADTKITELKVVGSTALDDVVITSTALTQYVASVSEAVQQRTITNTTDRSQDVIISQTWWDDQKTNHNLADNAQAATKVGGSGADKDMTVGDKYITGQDVDDGLTFGLKDMTFTKKDSTTTVNLKFPGVGSNYKILGSYTKDGEYEDLEGSKVSDGGGYTTYGVALPTDKTKTVKYFKVKASR